ncbi:MAG: hypothetical protein AAGL99_00670 [Pseudomonadota bacterium]
MGMLLRRVTKHVKDQNWLAVGIDFAIVVIGVFIGIQVANFNDVQKEQQSADAYVERLDEEFDIIRQRLDDGLRAYQRSISGIDLLLNAHRQRRETPDAVLPDEQTLGLAAYRVTSGSVPAGAPAAFKELIASGTLETIEDQQLRQALFAYDEFAAIARDGWKSIREEQHGSANLILSFIDLRASERMSERSNETLDGIDIVGFDQLGFLQSDEAPGALSVLLRSQVNQYTLMERQLELANDVETLLAEFSARSRS